MTRARITVGKIEQIGAVDLLRPPAVPARSRLPSEPGQETTISSCRTSLYHSSTQDANVQRRSRASGIYLPDSSKLMLQWGSPARDRDPWRWSKGNQSGCRE